MRGIVEVDKHHDPVFNFRRKIFSGKNIEEYAGRIFFIYFYKKYREQEYGQPPRQLRYKKGGLENLIVIKIQLIHILGRRRFFYEPYVGKMQQEIQHKGRSQQNHDLDAKTYPKRQMPGHFFQQVYQQVGHYQADAEYHKYT